MRKNAVSRLLMAGKFMFHGKNAVKSFCLKIPLYGGRMGIIQGVTEAGDKGNVNACKMRS